MDEKKTDFDIIVKKAQKNGPLSEEEALRILVKRLQNSKGYYTWTPMEEEENAAWLLRTPRNDLPDEVWLNEEPADFVHICKPTKYLEAALARDKDASSKVSAYIRDKNNNLAGIKEFSCSKCGKSVPEEIAKKIKMSLSLYKLQMKK